MFGCCSEDGVLVKFLKMNVKLIILLFNCLFENCYIKEEVNVVKIRIVVGIWVFCVIIG